MKKYKFETLLKQAIFDYNEATEDDEWFDVIQKLINDLEILEGKE